MRTLMGRIKTILKVSEQGVDSDCKWHRMVIAALVVGACMLPGVMEEINVPEMVAGFVVGLVIVVPALLIASARDKSLGQERESVRRKCEEVKAKGGVCDWSKAKGGTLRYPEPYLDHGMRKPYHTGKIKEARKPPSADAP